MSALAQALSAALIHFVWQGALIGALLWIALGMLRTRSAAARYIVCCAALALLVVVPAATAAAFILRAVPTDVRAVPTASLRTLIAPQPMLSIWMSAGTPSAPWLAAVQWWVLPVWSMGVLACSLRLAWGCTQAVALGRRGDPADESVRSMVADLAARMGVDRPVRVLMSTLVDGPGVLGWLRPVILLTPATAMGLTTSELEAVIAHELAHIKRCDYLINAFQMVAEAVFFYHPAIWWTSNRIRLERELCCDDLAIRSCGDPLCYARALATLEKQRINVPAMAMALTRDALLYRIQRLLGVSSEDYGPTRWPVVAALGLALVCASVTLDWTRLLAQTGADLPRFEVASVKPHRSDDGTFGIMGQPGGRLTATNANLRLLIRTAYQLQDDQIVGGPGWLASDRFDIVAKAPEGVAFGPAPAGQGPGTMQLMMRTLLSDRFKLTTHKETRELPIFALTTVKNDRPLGPQMRLSAVDCAPLAAGRGRRGSGGSAGGSESGREGGPGRESAPLTPPASGGRPECGMRVGPGTITSGGTSMAQLATVVSTWVNRIVVDRTRLTGSYDIDLQWTPDQMPYGLAAPPTGASPTSPLDPDRPSIFTALQEQLGLKLESQKGPVEVLVIDHVEPPTDD